MKLNEDKIHELPSIHPCVFYSFNFSFCHLLSLLFAIGFFSLAAEKDLRRLAAEDTDTYFGKPSKSCFSQQAIAWPITYCVN